ncbi:MAG: endonuclease/exonuclease/phosphatase family protein [Richelia sp. RM2_1_2]|nr:endonuclease/exonuclease/phosphatase family protein [Richelia sp. RM2_1_2]
MLIKLISILTFLSVFGLGIVSVGSYFAWEYPVELLTHFRVQYFMLSLIMSVIISILYTQRHLKSKFLIFCILGLVGLNAIEVIPWYLPYPQQITRNTQAVKFLQFNLNTQNNRYQEIIDMVRFENPDLALFIEVDQNAVNNLNAGLKDILPNSFKSPGGGLAILSRLPIQDARGDDLNAKNTNLIATVLINNQPVEFIGTHPFVPIKPSIFHRRNLQLAALSDYIQKVEVPLIVAGDFNLTPWSPYYRMFVSRTKLHNTRLGYGILPTWIRDTSYLNYPKWLVFIMENFLNIPIDHCFVSNDFKVAGIHLGNNSNSDHAPVINDLILKRKD